MTETETKKPTPYADMTHELRVHHKARDVAWFVYKCIDSDQYVLTDGRLFVYGPLEEHETLIDEKQRLDEANDIYAAILAVRASEEIPF
jgi:hypothetical protein